MDMIVTCMGANDNVVGLPLLSEGVAHALGLWQWTKDSTLSTVLCYGDKVYSGFK